MAYVLLLDERLTQVRTQQQALATSYAVAQVFSRRQLTPPDLPDEDEARRDLDTELAAPLPDPDETDLRHALGLR